MKPLLAFLLRMPSMVLYHYSRMLKSEFVLAVQQITYFSCNIDGPA